MYTLISFFLLSVTPIVTPVSIFVTLDQKIGEECKGLDPSTIIYVPVPGDCSKYIECYNEVGTLFQCPDGLWWHPDISECDYPGSYCSEDTTLVPTTSTKITTTSTATTITRPFPNTTTTTTTTTTTEPIPTIPPPGPDPRCINDSTEYWPHPASCSLYIECFKGDSYEKSCPPGLFFSDSHKKCVNEEDSDCCKHSKC